MTTTVISFRVHKNLQLWLTYAAKGFESEGELLRLMLTKASIEQASEAGLSRLVRDLLARSHRTNTGDTVVVATRIDSSTSLLVSACADRRGMSASRWCNSVVSDWYKYFQPLYQRFHPLGDQWLMHHSTEYRVLVGHISAGYSQQITKSRS